MATKRALVFGATGDIGGECVSSLASKGWEVLRASRASTDADLRTSEPHWVEQVRAFSSLDAVVWASGCNWSDTVLGDRDSLRRMLDGNIFYIQETLQAITSADVLNNPCRFVVLSSVWQESARSSKFSYIVSKSALSGLVRSAMIDLATFGISINAVLPGPVNTDMTRRNLTNEQIMRFEPATPIGRLVRVQEVANTVAWLCSDESAGVNGQSITVDGGFLGARVV